MFSQYLGLEFDPEASEKPAASSFMVKAGIEVIRGKYVLIVNS